MKLFYLWLFANVLFFQPIQAKEGIIEVYNRSSVNIGTISLSTNLKGNADMQLVKNITVPLTFSYTKLYYELNSIGYIEINGNDASRPIFLFLEPGEKVVINIHNDSIEVKAIHKEIIEYFYNTSKLFYNDEFNTIFNEGSTSKNAYNKAIAYKKNQLTFVENLLQSQSISQEYFNFIEQCADMQLLAQINYAFDKNKIADGMKNVAKLALKDFNAFDEKYKYTRINDWCNAIDLQCRMMGSGVISKSKSTQLGLWDKEQNYYNYAPKNLQKVLAVYSLESVATYQPSQMPNYEGFYKNLKKKFPNDMWVRYFQKYFYKG